MTILTTLTTLATPMAHAATPASTTAKAKAPLPEDETAALLELAYRRLREREGTANAKAALRLEAAAYRALEDVASRFDELIDDRGDLAVAVGGDAGAAWRGRPHERVVALLTLATLDVRRKRCDLALPTIKSAMHHRLLGRLQAARDRNIGGDGNADDPVHGASSDDVAIASVLRLRCAAMNTDPALRQEALVALDAALQGLGKGQPRDDTLDVVAIADAPRPRRLLRGPRPPRRGQRRQRRGRLDHL